MRQDPPFDMAYITATHLLEHVHPRTLVVNDPVQVRNAPEKLFVTHFAEMMPPTLITSDRAEVEAFRAEHRDIIVKRSEEHTSELQSLMRISYAVFCLKKKNHKNQYQLKHNQ